MPVSLEGRRVLVIDDCATNRLVLREMLLGWGAEVTETVDGKSCYKVVLTPEQGEPETRYYDRESGLLLKTEITLELPMGTVPMEVYSSDYREVDGIRIAHQGRVVVLGQERLVTTESIEHNVELAADRFTPPADVQTLLERRAASVDRE